MTTLAQRDASATFSPREGELRELADRRTRSAKVFELPNAPDGRRRYRIGAGIGPVHYPDDPFSAAPTWHEIDLSLSQVNDGTCDWQLTAAGYGVRLWQERSGLPYAAEFSRGGATYTMAPISLSWQDGEGNEEVIAKPDPGIKPSIDDDAYTITWADAFGVGLDYGYNCCPDKLYKALVIRDRGALPKPRAIDPARLVLRLWVQWGGGAAPTGNLPRAPSEYKGSSGETEAVIRRSNPYPHKRDGDGAECFWVQKPEAWDSAEEDQQRWALDWWYERRGTEVVLCLALDCTALDAATYPLLMDTAIAEEQVGASTDDASYRTSVSLNESAIYVNSSLGVDKGGFRFTSVPLPAGATIDSASWSVYPSSTSMDDAKCTLYCEDADASATFSASSPNRPQDRTLTSASVLWSKASLGASGFVASPDIKTCVQEVVDRDGWASGNALSVMTIGQTTAILRIYSWDGYAPYASKLNATYTEPALTASVTAATRTPTAYAPTAVPGTIAALPGAAARTPIAYQPTAAIVPLVAAAVAATRTAAAYQPTAMPGTVAALPAAAARTPIAYAPTGAPGTIAALPAAATRTAEAYQPTAVLGPVVAVVQIAERTPAAYQPTAVPGTIAALVEIAARTATAYQATGAPGAITALPGAAARTPVGYAAEALPGPVTALPGAATRTPIAYVVTAAPGVVVVYAGPATRTATAYQPTALPGSITAAVGAALRTATAYDLAALPGAVVAAVDAALRTALAYDATAELVVIDQTAYPGAAVRTATAWAPYPVTWDVVLAASQGRAAESIAASTGRLALELATSQGRLAIAYGTSDGRLAVGYIDSQGRLAIAYIDSDGRQA